MFVLKITQLCKRTVCALRNGESREGRESGRVSRMRENEMRGRKSKDGQKEREDTGEN